MRRLFLVSLFFDLFLPIQSHENGSDMQRCLAKSVEYLAHIDAWSEPRRIKSSCSCLIRKEIQGLATKGCPIPGRIKNDSIRKYFLPPS